MEQSENNNSQTLPKPRLKLFAGKMPSFRNMSDSLKRRRRKSAKREEEEGGEEEENEKGGGGEKTTVETGGVTLMADAAAPEMEMTENPGKFPDGDSDPHAVMNR